LAFNPDSTLALTDIGNCVKQDAQTIYNPGPQPRTWSWAVTTASSDTLWWSPTGTLNSWQDAVASPPSNITMAPGATYSVYVLVDTSFVDGSGTPTGSCTTGDTSSWTITLTDDLGRQDTFAAQLQ
jgi:hypothetical protein